MQTFGRGMRAEWPLDPDITYLNHGTVGVTPRRVTAAQRELQDQIERQPSRFLLRELTAVVVGQPRSEPPRLRQAAGVVAAFVGAGGDDVVFVDNATTGANAVVRSSPLEAGDELLVTDQGYGGVTNAATFAARQRGATVRTAALPNAIRTPEQITEACVAAIGPRTRLAIIDHIAAHTALIFPVADIARRFHERGVAVLVDGAHAPGAIPLDIPSLGVDWYVGNLHKWMWVPRSSAILWAAPERQAGVHPAVTSWGLDQGFTTEFDLPGTRDPSAHLTAPAALAYMRELGVEAVQRYNHSLAWDGARLLAGRWNTEFVAPESMIGTMATVMLPSSLGTTVEDAAKLRDRLLFEDRIEVQLHATNGRLYARISAQIYNDLEDIDRLGQAVIP
ncbi:MAG: class V aminotransferase [Acidobacteria bacterium RIFCSPLOWO2_02_FULL_67_36]|nr:MAG: class V aminotransferase [Acidobacteria bacterium RIFCSPLOWO2_02_FULL_67_36]OFW19422.1 MAG: class V aminotransferase [Acidobacteria bacterium RIFCSPLOWO2_12_FULL_66_21]